METRKIALACFIGGLLGAATTWYFSPNYWWLGLLSGFAGGYLSYEFREVLKAFVTAAKIAGGGVWLLVSEGAVMAKEWICEPHPCFYLSTSIAFCLTPLVVPFMGVKWQNINSVAGLVFVHVMVYVVVGIGIFYFVFPALVGLAKLGGANILLLDLERSKPLSYHKAYISVSRGLWLELRWLIVTVIALPMILTRFVWCFFRLIHSDKRLLCGVDGMLGGAASYRWLISPRMTIAEVVLIVTSGGLLGAFFGVLNWELVSKRMLKVEKAIA